ncbi:MAG: dTDP-4-dehydrorhamnose reductase [Flavobacteriales bacterium]|jgi:dTDP-4-dehydrorhamnose reductase
MNVSYDKIKVAVTGASGQLGQDFRAIASEYPRIDFFFFSRTELDVTNEEACLKILTNLRPDFIINAAAYTNVEKAEEDHEANKAGNERAPLYLARVAKSIDATLIHISTDYVFDGKKEEPLNESAAVNPLNEYGRAKLLGERLVLESGAKAFVIRTSWLYSTFGHNFLKTMIRLAKEKGELNVVNDQFASPTYARSLAHDINRMIVRLDAGQNIEMGLYHYSQHGVASWFDFAKEIVNVFDLNVPVHPVDSNRFPTKAIRPKYSKLAADKFEKNTGIELLTWQEGLMQCKKDIQ